MPTIPQEQIEIIAERLEQQESEITSYIDELAEVRQENLDLRTQIARLMSDRTVDI
jgi:cell division protein FtsB